MRDSFLRVSIYDWRLTSGNYRNSQIENPFSAGHARLDVHFINAAATWFYSPSPVTTVLGGLLPSVSVWLSISVRLVAHEAMATGAARRQRTRIILKIVRYIYRSLRGALFLVRRL